MRKLNPTVYMFGKKITDVVDNPRLRAGIESTGATYEVAELPEFRDLVVTQSPLINEPVNRFTLPPASIFRESNVKNKIKAAKRLAGVEN